MYVLVLDDDDDFHGVFQHAKKHSFQVEFFERRLLPNVNRIILARNYINEKRRLWKIPSDIKKKKIIDVSFIIFPRNPSSNF